MMEMTTVNKNTLPTKRSVLRKKCVNQLMY